jgi:hypothetical protein
MQCGMNRRNEVPAFEVNLLLGLWVLVSPWVLGFQGTTAAMVHIVVGILVAALAAIEMWLMQQTPQAPR